MAENFFTASDILLLSLQTQYERIKKIRREEGKISAIESDMLLSDMRELYKRMLHLSHLSDKDNPEEGKINYTADDLSIYNMVLTESGSGTAQSKIISDAGTLEKPGMPPKPEAVPSIHQKFLQTKEDTWAEKLQSQPLQDLKKSIGINEKFKFTNELFKGNAQQYNEAISFLSSSKTLEEAKSHIDDLISKYSWQKDTPVFQSFLLLVKRKFNS